MDSLSLVNSQCNEKSDVLTTNYCPLLSFIFSLFWIVRHPQCWEILQKASFLPKIAIFDQKRVLQLWILFAPKINIRVFLVIQIRHFSQFQTLCQLFFLKNGKRSWGGERGETFRFEICNITFGDIHIRNVYLQGTFHINGTFKKCVCYSWTWQSNGKLCTKSSCSRLPLRRLDCNFCNCFIKLNFKRWQVTCETWIGLQSLEISFDLVCMYFWKRRKKRIRVLYVHLFSFQYIVPYIFLQYKKSFLQRPTFHGNIERNISFHALLS